MGLPKTVAGHRAAAGKADVSQDMRWSQINPGAADEANEAQFFARGMLVHMRGPKSPYALEDLTGGLQPLIITAAEEMIRSTPAWQDLLQALQNLDTRHPESLGWITNCRYFNGTGFTPTANRCQLFLGFLAEVGPSVRRHEDIAGYEDVSMQGMDSDKSTTMSDLDPMDAENEDDSILDAEYTESEGSLMSIDPEHVGSDDVSMQDSVSSVRQPVSWLNAPS